MNATISPFSSKDKGGFLAKRRKVTRANLTICSINRDGAVY